MSFGISKLYLSDAHVAIGSIRSTSLYNIISLGKDVKDIDFSARPLRHLEQYEVHTDNEIYYSDDGILYTKDKKALVSIPSNKNKSIFVYNNTSGEVRPYAIYSTKRIAKLVINAPVIHSQAIVSCANLREIVFGEDVVGIKRTALLDLRDLQSISVHRNNRNYCSFESCLYGEGGGVLLYVPARLPARIKKHHALRYVADGAIKDRTGETYLY